MPPLQPTPEQVNQAIGTLTSMRQVYSSFSALRSKKFLVTFVLIGTFMAIAFNTEDAALARDLLWYCMWVGIAFMASTAISESCQAIANARIESARISAIASTSRDSDNGPNSLPSE